MPSMIVFIGLQTRTVYVNGQMETALGKPMLQRLVLKAVDCATLRKGKKMKKHKMVSFSGLININIGGIVYM